MEILDLYDKELKPTAKTPASMTKQSTREMILFAVFFIFSTSRCIILNTYIIIPHKRMSRCITTIFRNEYVKKTALYA